MSDAESSKLVESARSAFGDWRHTSFATRSTLLQGLADRLISEKSRLAMLMTTEMGKPIREAGAEIEKSAWACRYFAEEGESFLAEVESESDASDTRIAFEPLGPILAIMPWNFPFWQLFRVAAPGLMAGNVILLKHAPNVPQVAVEIEALFRRAGFPAGALQNLFVTNEQVAEIIGDPRVAAVTLTGSVRAGRSVAAAAGAAIKKSVLELGGSDPFVVLDDADLDLALEAAVTSRVLNNGQSCIAAKRFILQSGIADSFTEQFVDRMASLTIGDPSDPDIDIGPLARDDLRDALHDQVVRSLDGGARLLTGGRPREGPGYFYPATVLGGVKPGMPVFDEETFGPVAALIEARGEEEALDLANRSVYGLGAAVFTRHPDRIQRFVRGLEAGNVFVNGLVKSDPRLPFGGIKESGYGRELGPWGIKEFVNVKTVWVR